MPRIQTAVRATCQPPRCPASQGGEPPRTRHALPTSRAGLRVVLRVVRRRSCLALALAFILGHVVVRTAPFRLRVAATGGAATAPSSITELAGGGSWETPPGAPSSSAELARGGSRGTPAGAGAPGTGSTAPSAACRRACSRKAVMGDTIGGGGGVMPLVRHRRARRGRASAGARSE